MTKNTPTFYDFNDCREYDELQAATHWMWQTGNRWVAKSGETFESWFDTNNVADLGSQLAEAFPFEAADGSMIDLGKDLLIRDIANIPTTGTLVYDNADCVEVEISADDFWAEHAAA